MTFLPLIDGISRKSISLYVTAPNNVKRTEHFVSWHTFRQNYKASEGQLKNEAQQVHCEQHENGKAKYGLEAESPVNLSVLSDCACSVCNFVKNVSLKQLCMSRSQLSKMWDFVSFFRYCLT